MTHKHLLFSGDARTKVLRGATQIADAVRVTLGPKSIHVGAHTESDSKGRKDAFDDAMLLLTEATLTDLPEPKDAPLPASPMD